MPHTQTPIDSWTLSEYGLKLTLNRLHLLKTALLCMWYFNRFKQTHTPIGDCAVVSSLLTVRWRFISAILPLQRVCESFHAFSVIIERYIGCGKHRDFHLLSHGALVPTGMNFATSWDTPTQQHRTSRDQPTPHGRGDGQTGSIMPVDRRQ